MPCVRISGRSSSTVSTRSSCSTGCAAQDMAAIVDIQLMRLGKLLEDRKIVLDLSPAARAWLADKGYDPAYGARPLKRVIQKTVQDPLAERILAGTVLDGTEVTIGAGPDGLVIGDGSVAFPGAPPEPGSRALH